MDIYDRLRVEKLINAAGNNTNIGGSLAPEVFEAMMEAGRSFVDLVELSQKVGLEIARLARVEAAHVSSGAAGGVVLATAACLTGHSRRPSPSAVPRGFVQWGTEALGLNSEEIRLQLRNGIPRIDVLVRDREIIVSPLTLQPGEEQIVAERLWDLLA